MFRSLIFILLLPGIVSGTTLSPRWSPPIATLPYATYQGFHNETSGLDVYLGVRYAASTEGQNRWRAAQPPLNDTLAGIIDATSYPKQCPQATAGVSGRCWAVGRLYADEMFDGYIQGIVNASSYSPLQALDSEDCLFLNIYGKRGADKLPVLVWIHGGGWDREFSWVLQAHLSAHPPPPYQTTRRGNSIRHP